MSEPKSWEDFPFVDADKDYVAEIKAAVEPPATEEPPEEIRERVAREYLTEVASNSSTKQDPVALARIIAGEESEAARLRALGPEPNPAMTAEALENNPSNYRPPEGEAVQTAEQIDDEARHRAETQAAREAMIREETPMQNQSVAQDLAAPAVPRKKEKPADDRQEWICIGTDGIRSMTKGILHPVFRSDAHLLSNMVACPVCGKTSVRKVTPGEDLAEEDERATWTHLPDSERNRLMRLGAQRA